MDKSRPALAVVRITDSNLERYLPDICAVHMNAYPKGHFTNLLGKPDLSNYYRELILNSDISLVAESGRRLVGFLISGTHVAHGVANFTRDNRALLLRILLLNPAMAIEKVTSLTLSRMSKVEKSKATFRIMSIAVDSKAMRGGIGAFLIRELETMLAGLDVKLIGLSVRKGNQNAIDFYHRIGFAVEMQSRWALYFVKPVNAVAAGDGLAPKAPA